MADDAHRPPPDGSFRIAVAPDWEALQPPLAARAAELGLAWPAGLPAHRVAKIYSPTLRGSLAGPLAVLAWEPPREHALAPTTLAALDVAFGLGPGRALLAAGAAAGAVAALTPRLDAEGLYLAAAPAGPPARRVLAALPLRTIVAAFAALAARRATPTRTGSDHIVDRFAALPGLPELAVSRWRGDAFYRLAHPLARLEVGIDAPPAGAQKE